MSTKASANLVFGRYALEPTAGYLSNRCTVVFATDMTGEGSGAVALKFLSDREAWLKEAWMRGAGGAPPVDFKGPFQTPVEFQGAF
jgi:hypothetical protein